MRADISTLGLLANLFAAANGVRIVQSNDDGWAELYARSTHEALKASGHEVILSAPAENKSGSSSRDEEPTDRTEPCHFDSCPADSGPVGTNETDPDLNWVNAFPVTGMRFAIDEFAPSRWPDGGPELAVSGPNVGTNVWVQVPFSGTVGAAVFAAKERGIPAIAFSGASTGNLAWDTDPVPARSSEYGALAAKLVDAVVEAGEPYLPEDVWLNVNFQSLDGERCAEVDDYVWVLTRINSGVTSDSDAEHCGDDSLPREAEVILRDDGCYATISVGDANDKTTAAAEQQEAVIEKLGDFLTCLP